VRRKDRNWLLNEMVYGHLFHKANDQELMSLKKLSLRWKVCTPAPALVTQMLETFLVI